VSPDIVSSLFDRTEINGLILKNRLVRPPTWEGLATADGECTAGLVAFVSRRECLEARFDALEVSGGTPASGKLAARGRQPVRS
jgi:hypothetical protein